VDRPDTSGGRSADDPDAAPRAGERQDVTDTADVTDVRDGARPHRRSALIAVSVAAAVLLAGGGGAYWASTASDEPTGRTAGKAGPLPLALDGYGRDRAGAAEGGPGIAPGEPDPSGAQFRAVGDLPDGPASAPVHWVEGEVTRARATELAEAFGVPGAPRLIGDTWKFGLTRNASGPALDVSRTAPGTWTYARGAGGEGTGCGEPPAAGREESTDDAPSSSASAPRCPAPDGVARDGIGPVSEEDAKQAVAPILKGIGLSDAKIDASPTIGALRIVNAEPVIGGLPTYGWQTGLQVGSDGRVVAGSGHLTEPVKGPGYPVLGAEETLKELNRVGGPGRVGIADCASAMPHDGAAGTGAGAAEEPATPPAEQPGIGRGEQPGTGEGRTGGKPGAPEQADRLPCAPPDAPEPLPVRDAVFGLAVHFVDGRQALVPSWMFEVEQPGVQGGRSTFTVTHPAVRPEFIVQAAPGGPGAAPVEPGARTGPTRVESYSADGRTLTLRFWDGVCEDFTASAEADADTVRVRITSKDKKPGQVCIMVAEQFEEKVTLDGPLDGRSVVDATTGKAVPKTTGGPLPEKN
jgi:hypothetical protein